MKQLIALLAILLTSGLALAQPAGTPCPTGSYHYDQNSTNPDRREGSVTITPTVIPNQFEITVQFKNADGTWAEANEDDTSILRLDDDALSSTFGCYIELASGEGVGLINFIGTDVDAGSGVKAPTVGSEGSGTITRGT